MFFNLRQIGADRVERDAIKRARRNRQPLPRLHKIAINSFPDHVVDAKVSLLVDAKVSLLVDAKVSLRRGVTSVCGHAA